MRRILPARSWCRQLKKPNGSHSKPDTKRHHQARGVGQSWVRRCIDPRIAFSKPQCHLIVRRIAEDCKPTPCRHVRCSCEIVCYFRFRHFTVPTRGLASETLMNLVQVPLAIREMNVTEPPPAVFANGSSAKQLPCRVPDPFSLVESSSGTSGSLLRAWKNVFHLGNLFSNAALDVSAVVFNRLAGHTLETLNRQGRTGEIPKLWLENYPLIDDSKSNKLCVCRTISPFQQQLRIYTWDKAHVRPIGYAHEAIRRYQPPPP